MKLKATLGLLVFTSFFYAQNISYVHLDSIFSALPNYKSNVVKIDSISKEYQKEIKTAKEQWESKFNSLLKPYDVKQNEDFALLKARMTSVDTSRLSILIDEDKLITKRAQNYDLMLKTMYDNDVQPLITKVSKTIEDYAKLNKIDVVYVIEQLNPAVAYIDRRKNITKKIIAKISK
jgi:Skp family chaperone for outer membrane proteins